MKKILTFAAFALCFVFATDTTAQKVWKSSSKYESGVVKVHEVKSKYDADLVVYKVSSKYDTDKDGRWYFVDSKYESGVVKVFFTSSKYDADIKIWYASSKYDAGWRDDSKKHLLKRK